MARPGLIMSLAKVMIAAAWMDGVIEHEEVNSLKDLLFHLPDMTAHDWSELEIYLETPVGPEERARLVAELQAVLGSRQDRELAIRALEDLVRADGVVSGPEQAALQEIRTALEHVDTSIFGQVGRLMRTPVERRSATVAGAPNRERFLEDFIRNKIFYKLFLRQGQDSPELNLPEPELRKLSLAGGLMARVAYVDREVTEGEFEGMAALMEEHFGLSQGAAGLVAEVAVSTISKDLDYYRLTREFFEHTSEAERMRFLQVLFAVAAADGIVSHEEMEEIRTIATVLKLNHDQYIAAKLSIPRERRAY